MIPVLRVVAAALLAVIMTLATGCGGDRAEVRRLPVPDPTAVAADARGLYIGQDDGTVTRRQIDGDVAASMHLDGRIAALAVGGGSLVSLVQPGNHLISVDAIDLRPQARRHFDRRITAIAHGADNRLWVAFSGGTVSLLDDSTLRVIRTVPAFRPFRIVALAARGDAAYAYGMDGRLLRFASAGERGDNSGSVFRPRTLPGRGVVPDCALVAGAPDVAVATREGIVRSGRGNSLISQRQLAPAGPWALIGIDSDRLLAVGRDGLHRIALDDGRDTRIADLGPAAECGVAWDEYAFVLAPAEDAVLVADIPRQGP